MEEIKTNLDFLPLETLIQLTEYMSMGDFVNFCKTNRHLNRLCSQESYFWVRRLAKLGIKMSDIESDVSIINKNAKNIYKQIYKNKKICSEITEYDTRYFLETLVNKFVERDSETLKENGGSSLVPKQEKYIYFIKKLLGTVTDEDYKDLEEYTDKLYPAKAFSDKPNKNKKHPYLTFVGKGKGIMVPELRTLKKLFDKMSLTDFEKSVISRMFSKGETSIPFKVKMEDLCKYNIFI